MFSSFFVSSQICPCSKNPNLPLRSLSLGTCVGKCFHAPFSFSTRWKAEKPSSQKISLHLNMQILLKLWYGRKLSPFDISIRVSKSANICILKYLIILEYTKTPQVNLILSLFPEVGSKSAGPICWLLLALPSPYVSTHSCHHHPHHHHHKALQTDTANFWVIHRWFADGQTYAS